MNVAAPSQATVSVRSLRCPLGGRSSLEPPGSISAAWVLALGLAAAACSGRPSAPPPVVPSSGPSGDPSAGLPAAPPGQLLAPAQFEAIADRTRRSQALFLEASRVLTHARCVNCHPPDDTPRQGDAHALHDPPVLRGADDRGVPALGCTTCHQDRNVPLARVPGAPDWHLAPRSMVWLGKSPAQICVQLKDPARNGNRTLAKVQDHIAHDALVAWGWQPGADRAAAPGTQAQLAALVQAWIDTGAACPDEKADDKAGDKPGQAPGNKPGDKHQEIKP